MRINAQGGELVLRNEHGDTIIVPRERRKEAMKALLKDDHRAIDSLALQLPKAESYAAEGTVMKGGDPGKDLFRPDGTRKGKGFYGNLPNKNGNISSELSISSGDIEDGKDVLIPTLIPGLNKSEIDYLLSNKYNPQSRKGMDDIISRKAIDFARSRKQQGFPYFAHDIEEGAFKMPNYATGGTVLNGEDPFNTTLLKPQPYTPSNRVLDAKATLAGLSLAGNAFAPTIGYGAQLLNVGGDLYTGTRYAMDGQYKNAAIDYGEALVGLIPSSRIIGGKGPFDKIRVVDNTYANNFNIALDLLDLSNAPNNYDMKKQNKTKTKK